MTCDPFPFAPALNGTPSNQPTKVGPAVGSAAVMADGGGVGVGVGGQGRVWRYHERGSETRPGGAEVESVT